MRRFVEGLFGGGSPERQEEKKAGRKAQLTKDIIAKKRSIAEGRRSHQAMIQRQDKHVAAGNKLTEGEQGQRGAGERYFAKEEDKLAKIEQELRDLGGEPEKISTEQEEVRGETRGKWTHKVTLDKFGDISREERRGFKDPENPDESELKYHHEKEFERDIEARVVRETGRDFDKDNAWEKEFEYGEKGHMYRMSGETGRITSGDKKGHAWEKKFHYDNHDDWIGEEGQITADSDENEVGRTWQSGPKFENKE